MYTEHTNVRAADLAERIVEEISEANQDWHTIERCTRELLALASARDARARRSARYRGRMPAPTIDELQIADDGERWAALGFLLVDGVCRLGGVRLRFVSDGDGRTGIVGWSLRDIEAVELDGLSTTRSDRPSLARTDADAGEHPNGVVAIDHVVAMSPSLDRTVDALKAAGLDLRRVREDPTPAGAPRQAFFRLGEEILEVIQEPYDIVERGGGGARPTRFWGLAALVSDLDRTVELLGEHAGPARPAVQPGRRIATVRRSAGLAVPLALMSAPEAG